MLHKYNIHTQKLLRYINNLHLVKTEWKNNHQQHARWHKISYSHSIHPAKERDREHRNIFIDFQLILNYSITNRSTTLLTIELPNNTKKKRKHTFETNEIRSHLRFSDMERTSERQSKKIPIPIFFLSITNEYTNQYWTWRWTKQKKKTNTQSHYNIFIAFDR